MGKKNKRATLAGKSRTEYFNDRYFGDYTQSERMRLIDPQGRNPAGVERARINIADERNARAAAAAATGDWLSGQGKKSEKWGKRGVATPYVSQLRKEGWGAQNILEAADRLGIKSINSENDYDAMKDYLKRGEGSGDDIEKELKDREPEMELVENPYEDEPEGLDPFNKATKDYVYDTALDNLDTDDGLYARVFPLGSRTGQIGSRVPSPGDDQEDSASQSFASAMKEQIIRDMRLGAYGDYI